MFTCPRCGAPVESAGASCPACGGGSPNSDSDTVLSPLPGPGATLARPTPGLRSASPFGAALDPGTILADRYRIVGLLGRGGMGEVYRADDLTLGHAVALKFLPAAVAADGILLQRFLNEVRSARQVAHPNVCSVYDIGTAEGRHFITMEYVDGEDLASLLRRIGRLQTDKALEISRQLCAALGAVHDRGLLHCDLKPANVMLDGRGKVRLTDFGLAAAEGDARRAGEIAGTPAYMAPEQLAGEPPTVRSDLYALGLVLHELFTGRRVFDAETVAELRRRQQAFRPGDLASTTLDANPAIGLVIERCLAADPRDRPPSAFAVAAALPGGDPLAAALAAGETPSPDVVAAAGERGGLSARQAWLTLAGLGIALASLFALRAQTSAMQLASFDLGPEVLANKAQEMLARLGHDEIAADVAYGFAWEGDSIRWAQEHGGHQGWAVPAPGQLGGPTFWYRTSPELLFTRSWVGGARHISGRVTPADPPRVVPGMTSLVLDTSGRLLELVVVPPREEPDRSGTPAEPSWDAVRRETPLATARLEPVAPRWIPPVWADVRAAWTTTPPGGAGDTLRIEAAGFRGRPTYCAVLAPWSEPRGAQPATRSANDRVPFLVGALFISLLVGGAFVMAWRNVKLARTDRRGADRLALLIIGLFTLAWMVGTHHLLGAEAIGQFFMAFSNALFTAAFAWLVYLAIEPHVRRRWPHALISWSRLLSGRGADPLVGRDIVVGLLLGVGGAVLEDVTILLQLAHGAVPPAPSMPASEALVGFGPAFGLALLSVFQGLFGALTLFLLLFVFMLVLRGRWRAGVALVLTLGLVNGLGAGDPTIQMPAAVLMTTLFVVVLVKFGLVAFATGQYVGLLLTLFPMSYRFGAWHGWSTIMALTIVGAIAVYGFRAALAGTSLLPAGPRTL